MNKHEKIRGKKTVTPNVMSKIILYCGILSSSSWIITTPNDLQPAIYLCTWCPSPRCWANLSAQGRGRSWGKNRGCCKRAGPPGREWRRKASWLPPPSRRRRLGCGREPWCENGGTPRCEPTGTGGEDARRENRRGRSHQARSHCCSLMEGHSKHVVFHMPPEGMTPRNRQIFPPQSLM